MTNNALEVDGKVIDVLPANNYKVKICTMWVVIQGQRSGKMKRNDITLMEWDVVKVEISQYDTSKWRIVYRYRRNDIPAECLHDD